MDTNTGEYLRQAISSEIILLESVRESMRALTTPQRRHNVLAPVSSLPTEVTTAIFLFLRLPGTSPLGGKPDRHPAWLRVAHVCHQWREIALNLPLIWSQVDFITLTLAGAAEILARAKKAPLHLEARLPRGHWDDSRFSAFERSCRSVSPTYASHLTVSTDSSRDTFRLRSILKRLT